MMSAVSLYGALLDELESLDASDWMALQAFILKTGAITRTFASDRLEGLPEANALSSLSSTSEAEAVRAQLKRFLDGLPREES